MITMISITLYNATDIIKIVYGMNSPMVRVVHGMNGPYMVRMVQIPPAMSLT